MRKFIRGFVFAFRGLIACAKEERNFRFHLVVAFHLFVYLPFFTLNRAEQCVIIILCGMVIALEAVNSAIERAVDCTREISPRAGAAKDMAAGAVLVAAVVSVIAGIVLLWQPAAFAAILHFYLRYPAVVPAQLLLAAAGVWFVFFAREKNQ